MKLILAQPGTLRFKWELEVLLTNIRQFTDMEVVLLFSEHNFTVPIFFREKYGCSVFTFPDKREDTLYIPSIRPYLLWRYLSQYPEAEQETYLYIDSDIIFREWLDFTTLGKDPNELAGASCDGYIGYKYIAQCEGGPQIAEKMAEICGITIDQMKGVPGVGAQLILTNPEAVFWKRAYYDSNLIYRYLQSIQSNIQKWTAEMWAQQWGWVREGKRIIVSPELAFCLPTDPVERWDDVKILHNAGVLGGGDMFFKGQYDTATPFGQDFSGVRKDLATIKYVEAVQKVVY